MLVEKQKIILNKLPSLEYFKDGEEGLIMRKSGLKRESKIGAYNPFGQLIWMDENLLIIHLVENELKIS
jgi:hypothetical protein